MKSIPSSGKINQKKAEPIKIEKQTKVTLPLTNKDKLLNCHRQEQTSTQNSITPFRPLSARSESMLPLMSRTSNGFRSSINIFSSPSISVNYHNMKRTLSTPTNSSVIISLSKRTHNIQNNIPETITDRLKLFISIFKHPEFIRYYEKTPKKIPYSFDEIIDYLYDFSLLRNDIDHYAMFYYYLCHQITYDLKELNKDSTDIKSIFLSGVANNLQFSKLFEYMCKRKRMKVKHIVGFCKGMIQPLYKPGSDVNIINHYWNAVKFKGEWFLCDLTFGSGGIKEKNEQIKDYFNPYYFLTPGEYLIDTHRPIDDDWQLKQKIIPVNQFSNKRILHYSDFYHQIYKHEIDLISNKTPFISAYTKETIIKFALKDEVIQSYLYNSNNKRINEVKFSFNDKTNIYSLEPNFPENGNYIVKILSRHITSKELKYSELINFYIKFDDTHYKSIEMFKERKKMIANFKLNNDNDIKIKRNILKRSKSARLKQTMIISNYDLVFPNKNTKKICRDSSGIILLEPKSQIISIGIETKVKVRVKHVVSVVLLDNKIWHYLRKTDYNLWEGKFTIKSNNVSLLTMKPGSVYTEALTLQTQQAATTLLMIARMKYKNL